MGDRKRDWWVVGGMTVSAASAAVASFAGLRGLAVLTGWPAPLALLLPLTVDAYAMTATRVWLAASTAAERARRFARTNAIGAITLSLVGNGLYHLIAAGLLRVTWVVVVIVGAVPAAVLGMLSHMAALRTQADPTAVSRFEGSTDDRTQVRSTDQLLQQARLADEEHRAKHGRPITRDALREALHVGAARAGGLVRQLRAERAKEA